MRWSITIATRGFDSIAQAEPSVHTVEKSRNVGLSLCYSVTLKWTGRDPKPICLHLNWSAAHGPTVARTAVIF